MGTPMSARPSWAMTDPSTYSTIECTIDCGWTTTCTWSEATSNSQRASMRSEEHTSELQSHSDLVCRLLLEKKKDSEEVCDRACFRSFSDVYPPHVPFLEHYTWT